MKFTSFSIVPISYFVEKNKEYFFLTSSKMSKMSS